MFIMNQCIICLEDTNILFENENCKCKYYLHKTCLNQWSRYSCQCIICKAPIINKQSMVYNGVKKWSKELAVNWIVQPLLQILFIPIFITYQCFINAVYLLNVYCLESYDHAGR